MRAIGVGFLGIFFLAVILKFVVPLPAPLGYAPLDPGLGPRLAPVEVVIWYGTEKEAWLKEAANRFAARNEIVGGRPVKITLVGMGSREIADRVARQAWGDKPRPTVISPASSLWTALLDAEWAARYGGTIIADDPAPLVLTPLVAVAWEERAKVLWPRGYQNFWNDLHDAIANEQGWKAIAAANGFGPNTPEYRQAEQWGLVKLGHTSPLTSNSGAQAILLMAYAYHNKTSGLTVDDVRDSGFLTWLGEIQQGVYDLGDSTGTFMTNMVQYGPSKYDIVLVYENLAIEYVEAAEQRWRQALRVYYPPATIFSDHPYAILDDPLTSRQEREAAARFRDFLLQRQQQERALALGFRPIDPTIVTTSSDPSNPFVRYRNYGLSLDIAAQVDTPDGKVIEALLNVWDREIRPLVRHIGQ